MNELISTLNQVLNVSKPVSFREYCESEEYMNDPYLYDEWKRLLEDEHPEKINELVVDGSLGAGKTYAVSAYVTYRVMLLFRDGDPRPRYSLKPMSAMYGFYLSTNKTSAKQGGFKYLKQAFEACKWFTDYMPMDKSIESIIRFPSVNFEVVPASSDSHFIGLNVWFFILDEANFRDGVGIGNVEEYEEVTRIYEQSADRLASRFSTPNGVEGLGILISSASYQSAFTETRKEKLQGNPNAKIITAVTYKIKPWQFSKEMFKVFIGCGAVPPSIIESEDQLQRLFKLANILGTGNEDQFIRDVPVSLKPQFQTNIDQALQNHCGIPTQVKGRFLSNLRTLIQCYDENVPQVFASDYLEASTEDDTELIEYFLPQYLEYPDRPHALFLDLSVQNDTGNLTCVRFDGINNRGEKMFTRVFALKIVPPKPPAQTRISKVKNLVLALSEHISIAAFGSDQYQSTSIRQEVQAELGLDDIRLSLDSSDLFYNLWLQALAAKRWRQRPDKLLEKEATEAIHDYKKHRVIKSKKSSDDNLQGNVGAFALAETIASTAVEAPDMGNRRFNLVGTNSQLKMLKACGYTLG